MGGRDRDKDGGLCFMLQFLIVETSPLTQVKILGNKNTVKVQLEIIHDVAVHK